MELHTFSSLTKTFLLEYNATMANASCAMVYFNPKTIEHKKLIPITEKDVLEGFGGDNIIITTNTNEILKFLHQQNWHESNLLLMSSGNFDGLDLQKVIQLVLGA